MSFTTNTPVNGLSTEEAKAISLILESELGSRVALFDTSTGLQVVIDELFTDHAHSAEFIRSLASYARPMIMTIDPKSYQAILPIKASGGVKLIGMATLVRYASEDADSKKEIQRLETLCRLLLDKIAATSGKTRDVRAVDSQVCSVLAAYDVLFRNIRLHGDSSQFQRHALKAVMEVVGAEMACWILGESATSRAVSGMETLSSWECRQLAGALNQRTDWDRPDVLIDNAFGVGPHASRFPMIASLIAVKVESEGTPGYIVLVNKSRRDARQGSRSTTSRSTNGTSGEVFTRGDAGLMTSFSTLIAAQGRTSRRHFDLKELIVGLTRALTAAIDAKDGYTAGHSERVGRMAVVLGKELGLVEEQLNDIYLAGLLHDVGKIGIRDEVLGKAGKLTDEERKHIEEHVVIGHRILSGLSGIEPLLDGVLHHHEQYNGGGYPSGLVGENIPRLARILAVADSFDAMNSDRPYRRGMSTEKVEAIFLEGRGVQWDPVIVDAFFRCRSEMSEIRQRGIGDSLREALNGVMQKESAEVKGSLKFAAS
ncbi:MAG: hypothetical protein JWN70_5315 [Planctomycetaceae bacterium]|nr:hypothetical protein [Planctomycetaceae bacterium]